MDHWRFMVFLGADSCVVDIAEYSKRALGCERLAVRPSSPTQYYRLVYFTRRQVDDGHAGSMQRGRLRDFDAFFRESASDGSAGRIPMTTPSVYEIRRSTHRGHAAALSSKTDRCVPAGVALEHTRR